MKDWNYHELALAVGYRALGEDASFIAAAIGRPRTDVNTLLLAIDAFETAHTDGGPVVRQTRMPSALASRFAPIRDVPFRGDPPPGRSALDQLKLDGPGK